MKLKAQIEEERHCYLVKMKEAKKQNNKEIYEIASAVVAALDWVRGSRNNDIENIEDYLYRWKFHE